ncbi:E3 ubiquitin-protein ligase ATL31-like [Juglans microcarpa x Juglans regia]|uniref:E3 ubiquitin-protein ligase ATL31-like n=1 Tax=Juglans microcarpa x Juglans regia TaxID=2249226 RepID=UPI001B7DE855|nr:E3 ubiquitin-protein ligase ATL31-like [Juglans microcarpa x Juglans regia]
MRVWINLCHPVVPPLVLLFLSPVYFLADAQSGSTEQISNNPYGPDANFNQSMAVVVVFLMVAFFLMAFFSIYIRECLETTAAATHNNGPVITTGQPRHHGLDHTVIETFPIFVYSTVKDLKIGKGALECAVCLSEFEHDEMLRLLPRCYHVFHPDCIDAWLASHVTCPVCRAKLELGCEAPQSSTDSTDCSSRDENPSPEVVPVEMRNEQVLIDINADHSTVEIANCPSRTRISGKFPRSHSTGHSLVQPGENTERYTLRLPEEVRKQMILVSGKLRRSCSYDVVLGRIGSREERQCGPGGWSVGLVGGVSDAAVCIEGWLREVSKVERGGKRDEYWKQWKDLLDVG